MDRKSFLKTIGVLGVGLSGLPTAISQLNQFAQDDYKHPVLFIGHGTPMNAIEKNTYTQALANTGKSLKKPKAILVVSAHWLTKGTFVTANPKPETIYDFGGFPKEMYDLKYPSPGSPQIASEIISLNDQLKKDEQWGLDHGAWTFLLHMFPQADIPVLQLSIDYTKDYQYHYDLVNKLKSLRSKGVLIIGSGNITHNLGRMDWNENAPVTNWAKEFDEKVKQNVLKGDHYEILNYKKWGNISTTAHPSDDHFIPLMYTLGLQEKNESVQFIYEGFQHGSISMRCIRIG